MKHTAYIIVEIPSGIDFIEQYASNQWDALVIARSTDDLTGRDVLRHVREQFPADIPILMIGDPPDEAEIISSFQSGADDYVTSSISTATFDSRIMALLRRTSPRAAQCRVEKHAEFEFHDGRCMVIKNGVEIHLQRRQFEFALMLFRNIGSMIERKKIAESIWRMSEDILLNSLNSTASVIRKKLDLYPQYGYVLTVKSSGCQLKKSGE